MSGRLRSVGFAVAALLSAMGIASCGGGSSQDGARLVGGSGRTLTVAVEADLREPDNILASISVDKLIMGSTVYDPLVTADSQGKPLPALAVKWTPSKDLRTWTFKLRKGVKFTDGKPFTAQDVKDNFEAFQNPKNASDFAGDLANLASTEVTDSSTVTFHLKKPDSRFPYVVEDTMFIGDLSNRHGSQLLKAGETPVGTGPYKWSSRQQGTSITFVANPHYWRGAPPLSEVVFKAMEDPQLATLAVQNGDVDAVVNNIAPQSVESLQHDPNLHVRRTLNSTFYQAYFDYQKDREGGYKDFDSIRRGLADLMDTEHTIPPVIGAYGQVATQPLPSWEPGYDPNIKPVPYNEAEGERLLAQGGIPKGGTINILVFNRPYTCEWGTALQAKLKKLGYDATLDCQEPEVAPAKITKYKWDILIARTSGRPTAAVMFDDRWSIAVADPSDDFYTLRDPKLQSIIDQMHETLDDQKYAALGRQADDQIMNNDVAAVAGYYDYSYIVANNKVNGLVPSHLTYVPFLYNGVTKVSVTR